jgi:N-acetylmuramoyl-L-alanine amidase
MTKKNKKGTVRLSSGILSGALALAIGMSAFSPSVLSSNERTRSTSHESEYINLETGKIEYTLPGITTRRLWEHSQRSVTVNGKQLAEPAVVMNGTLYLPLRAFASSLGDATVNYNKSTKTATLKMPGLTLTATDAGFVTYANDSALFSFSPNLLMSNGKMYLPASVLSKALGVEVKSQTKWDVTVSGKYTPLLHASKFYREDEVYWLAKIISAESGGESLIGQIAVGDVILNRVNSSLYPNTIYSVIFDRKYGVQFSPILDGSIYKDPTFTATLAAKICLEGTSLSDNALFFLNPTVAESNWIVKNREYAYSIGGHDFYL